MASCIACVNDCMSVAWRQAWKELSCTGEPCEPRFQDYANPCSVDGGPQPDKRGVRTAWILLALHIIQGTRQTTNFQRFLFSPLEMRIPYYIMEAELDTSGAQLWNWGPLLWNSVVK